MFTFLTLVRMRSKKTLHRKTNLICTHFHYLAVSRLFQLSIQSVETKRNLYYLNWKKDRSTKKPERLYILLYIFCQFSKRASYRQYHAFILQFLAQLAFGRLRVRQLVGAFIIFSELARQPTLKEKDDLRKDKCA